MERYTITVQVVGKGTVSPAGPQVSLSKGGSQTFTFTPAEGNELQKVTVAGVDVTAEAKKTSPYRYTVQSLQQNCILYVSFGADPSVDVVDKAYLKENKGKQGFLLVDVRPKAYFDGKTMKKGATGGHIDGAINVPLAWIAASSDSDLESLGLTKDKTLILYCNMGVTSGKAASELIKKGYASVKNYGGGMLEWGADASETVRRADVALSLSDVADSTKIALNVSPDVAVSWSATPEGVVKLSSATGAETGLTALKAGTATVKAAIDGQASAETKVTVAASSSSGGGCQVGATPAVLLLAAPLLLGFLKR